MQDRSYTSHYPWKRCSCFKKINTPRRLERDGPSCLSSSACGCSASTLCPASWPELASADLLRHKGSSAPSASSHNVPTAPVAKHSAEIQSCFLPDGCELAALCSHLLLTLLVAAHADLQILQQVVHLLDLSLSVSHALHHVLQLHHTLIGFFLKSGEMKNMDVRICMETFLEKGSISTYNGDLDILDNLPHLLHLTLQLLWRLHNLRLEFADVLLQAADVHLHLSLRDIMLVSSALWILLETFPPRFRSNGNVPASESSLQGWLSALQCCHSWHTVTREIFST